MGLNKYVHMMFAVGGLILATIFIQASESVWRYFARYLGRPNDLLAALIGGGLAAGVTLYYWRNPRVFDLATEVVSELKKVTWPTRKETSNATVVVIITVFISAMFLGFFDLVWSWSTDLIYK
jgi:preprotein translocase subunit SecE